jgi:hypothetical protein
MGKMLLATVKKALPVIIVLAEVAKVIRRAKRYAEEEDVYEE